MLEAVVQQNKDEFFLYSFLVISLFVADKLLSPLRIILSTQLAFRLEYKVRVSMIEKFFVPEEAMELVSGRVANYAN